MSNARPSPSLPHQPDPSTGSDGATDALPPCCLFCTPLLLATRPPRCAAPVFVPAPALATTDAPPSPAILIRCACSWDTTGQEEVGVWGAFYNASSRDPFRGELQLRAVNSILAYMPSTPNFAYHGSAGGWGDFSNNGKWMVRGGWEREGNHYRAGLNSIPLAERFRSHPDELYLLECAMGGITGVLGTIDADGAPSMAFHTYPFMLEYDPHTGDSGLGFFGHSMNVGAYSIPNHPRFGSLCYLCAHTAAKGGRHADRGGSTPRLTPSGGLSGDYALVPHDSFHRRAYLADLGLWVEVVSAHRLQRIEVFPGPRNLVLTVADPPAGALSSKVRVQLSTPALPTGRRRADMFAIEGAERVRGAWQIAMPAGASSMDLKATWTVAL